MSTAIAPSEVVELPPATQDTQHPTPALLLQMAVQQGADLEKMERLMALQERWEANEARKAYHVAVAAFKAKNIRVTKTAKFNAGPLSGAKYANLADWVRAVTGGLSDCGLSAAWKPVPPDEKVNIRIRCTLSHALGHGEYVEFEGPPDTSGAKNALQARASTVKYLERYTLEMILGLTADDGEDDDGAGGAGSNSQTEAKEHPKLQAGRDAAMEGMQALTAWWGALAAKERSELNNDFKGLRQVAQQVDRGG